MQLLLPHLRGRRNTRAGASEGVLRQGGCGEGGSQG
ncbi:hypothetical protein E2C01_098557 [Portunus trituberculatus]|uniref:Uncharacterized protein n=1 Tax=Portunus trituberculatus TaxID=210409 RepID=A0A5B7KCE3_PORTR|nr:hypothetical protein [Portunus trituberculatus]